MADKNIPEAIQALARAVAAAKTKHQVVEVTDLKNGGKTYNIFERGTLMIQPPVARGLKTLEEAETLARALDAKETP